VEQERLSVEFSERVIAEAAVVDDFAVHQAEIAQFSKFQFLRERGRSQQAGSQYQLDLHVHSFSKPFAAVNSRLCYSTGTSRSTPSAAHAGAATSRAASVED
jgi:hypothetical protein